MISFKKITEIWNNFFFAPKPVEGIAFFRIIFGCILAFALLCDSTQLEEFFGPFAITSLETVKSQFNYINLNLFFMFKNGHTALYFLYALYWIGIIGMIFGIFTRYSMVLVFLCLVSFHQRNIWLLSSSELIMRIGMFLMIFSPAGYAFSVDCLLAKKFPKMKRPREHAPWVQNLLLIQLSAIYVFTVYAKIKGDNWFDGSAVYYASRLTEMTRFPVPFLLDSLFVMKMMTWGTLVIELMLGTLIWFSEFRRPLILIGIIFHLSIEYMMSIPMFEWLMIAMLMLWFKPEEYRAFAMLLKQNIIKGIQDSTISPKLKASMISYLS
jgi:hypothetical protein